MRFIQTDYITAILLYIPNHVRNYILNQDIAGYIRTLNVSKGNQVRNKEHASYTKVYYRSESLNQPGTANIYYNNLDGGPLPGDSGGPIFTENKNGTYLQRGISQYVHINYDYKAYSMYIRDYHVHDSTGYANIHYYLPWIKQVAKENDLGVIRTAYSDERELTSCEKTKHRLNQIFIEKLGINLIDSTLRNDCSMVNPVFAQQARQLTAVCGKLCGSEDLTCKFSSASMKAYESYRKVLCAEE